MKLLLALLGLGYVCALPHGPPDHPDWTAFKSEHGKSYMSLEDEHTRFQNFMQTKAEVDQHNQEYEEGKHTSYKKLDQFADLSDDEFRQTMFGLRPKTPEEEEETERLLTKDADMPQGNYYAPSSIDWRTKHAVTPVQNQGSCGSCWTFAAVAALEGRLAVKTKKLTKLSEQNLLDCTSRYEGCNGGRYEDSFNYIKKQGGIDTETAYPYRGTKGTCHYSKSSKGGYDNGYKPVRGEAALKTAVAAGPVAVAIDANSIMRYAGGVHHCPAYGQRMNHAVTAVGYGHDSRGGDYWLIKNSWSTRWGEDGYIKIARGSNSCLIGNDPAYPVV